MGAVLIGVDPAKRSNTIEVINASEKTVQRDWIFAKAWLSKELKKID